MNCGTDTSRGMRFCALSCVILATATAAAPSRLLVAGGVWAGVDRGNVCEAIAKPVQRGTRQQAQPYVSIAFDRAGPRHGQMFVRLRRPARPGSTILLRVGDRPFMLVARGASAWSSDDRQETAIIAAMRSAGGMRIEARDTSGRRMVDRYLLAGAPTAIDAAAAACSLPR